MYLAVITKKLCTKKNSLTSVNKYRFARKEEATDFLYNIKKLDKKILYTHLEKVAD